MVPVWFEAFCIVTSGLIFAQGLWARNVLVALAGIVSLLFRTQRMLFGNSSLLWVDVSVACAVVVYAALCLGLDVRAPAVFFLLTWGAWCGGAKTLSYTAHMIAHAAVVVALCHDLRPGRIRSA